MTLRIMHVNLARGFRGGERQTELLIQALATQGVSQQLVCRGDSPLRAHLQGTPGLKFVTANHQLMGHWRAEPADLVHAHEAKAVHWAWLHHGQRATPATQTLLTGAKAKLGMVPNLFSTLAHSPAALAGYLQLNDALQQGALSAKDREIVSIAAAQFNGCGYCLSAHTLMGKGAGLPADAIAAARQGQGSAVAALTHQVLRARGQISDGELAAARDAGLSDAQIAEVVAAVALNVLTNYFNNLAGTEIDFPRVAL